MKNTWLLVTLVGATVSFFYFYKSQQPVSIITSPPEINLSYQITKIEIVSGDEFYLKLDDGRSIKAHLEVDTLPGTKSKVIGLLNDSKLPRVKIRRKDQDGWLVDIFLSQNGQEISLSDWLRLNKMVLE